MSRLTDQRIGEICRSRTGGSVEVVAMALELQERRTSDLTPPQLEDLHIMLRMAVAGQPIVCGPERVRILRDVLQAHGRPCAVCSETESRTS